MPRSGLRGRAVSSRVGARRPPLLLETMESRRLLSTAGASTTITPNIQVFAETSGVVGPSSLTNPTPSSTALTPALVDVAYGINRA